MGIAKYGKSRNPEGRPSQWKLGKTKMIRVPIAIAEPLLTIARIIDKRGIEVLNQSLELLRSTISEGSQSSNFQISPGYSESSGSTHP